LRGGNYGVGSAGGKKRGGHNRGKKKSGVGGAGVDEGGFYVGLNMQEVVGAETHGPAKEKRIRGRLKKNTRPCGTMGENSTVDQKRPVKKNVKKNGRSVGLWVGVVGWIHVRRGLEKLETNLGKKAKRKRSGPQRRALGKETRNGFGQHWGGEKAFNRGPGEGK